MNKFTKRIVVRYKSILIVIMCQLWLAGCAISHGVRTSVDENSSLIFGFYDMSEAPYELGCVRITQNERAGIVYRQSCMTTFTNGLFFSKMPLLWSTTSPFFMQVRDYTWSPPMKKISLRCLPDHSIFSVHLSSRNCTEISVISCGLNRRNMSWIQWRIQMRLRYWKCCLTLFRTRVGSNVLGLASPRSSLY